MNSSLRRATAKVMAEELIREFGTEVPDDMIQWSIEDEFPGMDTGNLDQWVRSYIDSAVVYVSFSDWRVNDEGYFNPEEREQISLF